MTEIPPVSQPNSESQQTPTPISSSTPPVPAINPEFEVIRQQLNSLGATVGQLAQVVAQRNAAPQASQAPITREEFEDNPQSFIDRIQSDIARQIAPLNEFRNQFARTTEYQNIKNQVKNFNPNLSRYWPHIEPILDQMFASGQTDVNPQLVLNQARPRNFPAICCTSQ